MIFDEVHILDGGLATELMSLGYKIEGDALWSAKGLVEDPSLVQEVHKRFLMAGADILETNTYQASIPLLQSQLSLTEGEAVALLGKAVNLAKSAAESQTQSRKVWLAGSIGPFGCQLCDGSEYTGSYIKERSREELTKYHEGQARALSDFNVDLLAFETVPALAEAECILQALDRLPNAPPAWISFSCQDSERTSFGDRFCSVVERLSGEPKMAAIGINCTAPQFLTPLLKSAQPFASKPFVVYPNSGESWERDKGFYGSSNWDRCSLEVAIPEWISLGVRVIGGCCRISSQDIATIKQIIDNSKLR